MGRSQLRDAIANFDQIARVFPFTTELRILLEAQKAYTRKVELEQDIGCPWVFHRSGKPIHYCRRNWISACKAAGCPTRIPHDFRRTAVRKLVRAGVTEHVAMTLTGHKTRSVFERYNIAKLILPKRPVASTWWSSRSPR